MALCGSVSCILPEYSLAPFSASGSPVIQFRILESRPEAHQIPLVRDIVNLSMEVIQTQNGACLTAALHGRGLTFGDWALDPPSIFRNSGVISNPSAWPRWVTLGLGMIDVCGCLRAGGFKPGLTESGNSQRYPSTSSKSVVGHRRSHFSNISHGLASKREDISCAYATLFIINRR